MGPLGERKIPRFMCLTSFFLYRFYEEWLRTKAQLKFLGVDRNQQSVRCGFRIGNVLKYSSLILSSVKSPGVLHNNAFISVIFVIRQTQQFFEHTLTVNAPRSMLRLPYNDWDRG